MGKRGARHHRQPPGTGYSHSLLLRASSRHGTRVTHIATFSIRKWRRWTRRAGKEFFVWVHYSIVSRICIASKALITALYVEARSQRRARPVKGAGGCVPHTAVVDHVAANKNEGRPSVFLWLLPPRTSASTNLHPPARVTDDPECCCGTKGFLHSTNSILNSCPLGGVFHRLATATDRGVHRHPASSSRVALVVARPQILLQQSR